MNKQGRHILEHMFVCAFDFLYPKGPVEVSISEKVSLWSARLTPGKQMCRTGQALNPDQSLWSQTFNCHHRLIESGVLCTDLVSLSVFAVSIAEQHIVSPPTDLSLKT